MAAWLLAQQGGWFRLFHASKSGLKGWLLGLVLSWVSIGALATDLNQANQQQLLSIRGIGPVMAQRILQERSAYGPFQSYSDLVQRVRGIGPKTAERFKAQGARINGSVDPYHALPKVIVGVPRQGDGHDSSSD